MNKKSIKNIALCEEQQVCGGDYNCWCNQGWGITMDSPSIHANSIDECERHCCKGDADAFSRFDCTKCTPKLAPYSFIDVVDGLCTYGCS